VTPQASPAPTLERTYSAFDISDLHCHFYGATSGCLSRLDDSWKLTATEGRDHAATAFANLPSGTCRYWTVELAIAWPAADERCPVFLQDDNFAFIADETERHGFDSAVSGKARLLMQPGRAGSFVLPRQVSIRFSPDPKFGLGLAPLLERAGPRGADAEYVPRLRNALFADLVEAYPDYHLDHLCDRRMHRGVHWFLDAYDQMRRRKGGVLCSGAAQLFSDLLWFLGIPAWPICFGSGVLSHAATLAFCRDPSDADRLIPTLHDAYFNYHLELTTEPDDESRMDFRQILAELRRHRAENVVAVAGRGIHCLHLSADPDTASTPVATVIDNSFTRFAQCASSLPFRDMLRHVTGRENLLYLFTLPFGDKPACDPEAVAQEVDALLRAAAARLLRLRALTVPMPAA